MVSKGGRHVTSDVQVLSKGALRAILVIGGCEEIALFKVQGHSIREIGRRATTRTIIIITLPQELRPSLTWDQGAEMVQHDRLKVDAGCPSLLLRPRREPDGLLRQYFPKGTYLSIHSADEIAAVAAALNARPRKNLGWKTPAEALDESLP